MRKASIVLIIVFFLISTAAFCLADEKKDHVCFRALDSNDDDMVTFEEFEKAYGNDREKFNAADTDNDGKLTHDEYHEILGGGSQ